MLDHSDDVRYFLRVYRLVRILLMKLIPKFHTEKWVLKILEDTPKTVRALRTLRAMICLGLV